MAEIAASFRLSKGVMALVREFLRLLLSPLVVSPLVSAPALDLKDDGFMIDREFVRLPVGWTWTDESTVMENDRS
jgi:hypothetical protein